MMLTATAVDLSRGHSNSTLRRIIRSLAHKPQARYALIGPGPPGDSSSPQAPSMPVPSASGVDARFCSLGPQKEYVPTLRLALRANSQQKQQNLVCFSRSFFFASSARLCQLSHGSHGNPSLAWFSMASHSTGNHGLARSTRR